MTPTDVAALRTEAVQYGRLGAGDSLALCDALEVARALCTELEKKLEKYEGWEEKIIAATTNSLKTQAENDALAAQVLVLFSHAERWVKDNSSDAETLSAIRESSTAWLAAHDEVIKAPLAAQVATLRELLRAVL